MQRTTRGLQRETATRLADLQRHRPEWRGWLALLEEVRRAMDDSGWEMPLAAPRGPAVVAVPASATTALLHGHTLEVDAGRARRLVRRLASAAARADATSAASLRGYRPAIAGAIELLTAAASHDRATIASLATQNRVDAGALATVAYLAALPLLHAARRQLDRNVPTYWPHGACPICAALPIVAERRGLDGTRRLRCGRCGGDWQASWLCCTYCGEKEHDQLGSLVPEESGETLRLETCARCRGYIKSIATLQAIPPLELFLRDLETVELDLVALDRGYTRPPEGGATLDVRVTARPSPLIRRVLRNG